MILDFGVYGKADEPAEFFSLLPLHHAQMLFWQLIIFFLGVDEAV